MYLHIFIRAILAYGYIVILYYTKKTPIPAQSHIPNLFLTRFIAKECISIILITYSSYVKNNNIILMEKQ